MKNKKLVKEEQHLDDSTDFLNDETIEDCIKYFKELATRHGKNARVEYKHREWAEDGGYFMVVWERAETDKEYEVRIKREAKAKERRKLGKRTLAEKKEANELKEYERLKKKFG